MINMYNIKHKTWEGKTSVCFFHFFIDGPSDLPDDPMYFSTEADKYKIAPGSIAIDVTNKCIYTYTSAGTWTNWSN